MNYYAVANGRTNGIFTSWFECKKSIDGYKKAKFKKFDNKDDAQQFIDSYNTITSSINTDKAIISSVKTDKTVKTDNNDKPILTSNYYVYTDGACSNNGKSNAKAGIGIYFGKNDIRNISSRISGKQTNNTAELYAIIKTYEILESEIVSGKQITIVTDSEYALKCIGSYGKKCSHDNWLKPIPNKELVKTIFELYNNKPNVSFLHIMAHTNKDDIHSCGNYEADKLANLALELKSCPYNF